MERLGSEAGRLLRKAVFWFYISVEAAALMVVLLFRDGTDYRFKLLYPVPTWLFLLVGTGAAVLCALLLRRYGSLLERFRPALFFFLFFLAQVYICYNCYFETGWDVETVMIYARMLSGGESLGESAYLSKYPNNIFLTWLLTSFLRLHQAAGILDADSGSSMAVIVVQCALSSCTGLLVWKTALRLWKSPKAAWAAALFYCVLVGISPWMMIPYSDSLGLIIPMLALYLYLSMKNGRRLPWKWALIGLLAYWGYRLKPTCVICVIAIAGVEALKLLGGGLTLLKERWKSLAVSGVAFAAAIFLSGGIFSYVMLPSLGVELDRKAAFGPSHFFMMGLNETTNGSFDFGDVILSESAATRQERTRIDLQTAGERIRENKEGMPRHTLKKALVNFGDGTFAWSFEGSFYKEIFPLKNKVISPLLREIYYQGGRFFGLFAGFEQSVWLFALLAPLGLLFIHKRGFGDTETVMMLSLFGLTLFNMLFEARARYLYIYAPYYVLLASAGWWEVLTRFRIRRTKTAAAAV